MKCPKCKSNKKLRKIPDLKTLRTLADNGRVRRERSCPKCKSRMWTVELLEAEYENERREEKEKLYKEEELHARAEDKLTRIKELYTEFNDIISHC